MKGIAEYSPGIVKPIAGFAYGVANQLGYGINLPGAPSQHGHGLVKTLPYKPLLRGTGLSRNTKGGGLLLPGQKASTLRRPRIIKPDVIHEVIGSGFHGNNRLY